MSPQFKDRLNKAFKILMMETKAGCHQWLKNRRLCRECSDKLLDAAISPKSSKHLQQILGVDK